jgi:carbamoyl-phosphate synthase large subunit
MLQRSEVDEKHLVPRVSSREYVPVLRSILEETKPDLLCPLLDAELPLIAAVSKSLGVRTFLPAVETLQLCADKMLSQQVWEKEGVPVPRSILLRDETDLRAAFQNIGASLWVRAIEGTGGSGSLAVSDFETAKAWIDSKQGWGTFMAAELLGRETATWQSIWRDGQLLVAQTKKRLYWEFSKLAPSGVTGITGASLTVKDPLLNEISVSAVQAMDPKPHGIFGVDITYDRNGNPKITEINCGRFFTSHYFFTAAGLNLTYIYVKAALDEPLSYPVPYVNPLPPGQVWIRGMDREPILTDLETVNRYIQQLEARRASLTTVVARA